MSERLLFGFHLAFICAIWSPTFKMNRVNIFFPRVISILSFAFLLFVICGCVSPKVTVKPGAKLDEYRKVYLAAPEYDPNYVQGRVASRLRKAGFEVVQTKPGDPYIDSQGSGFVITSQGLILTCAHVVGTLTNATVWIEGSRSVGHVVARDTNLDVALIQLDDISKPLTPLAFASRTNYSMGQDVFSMGFPLAEVLGFSPRLNKGLVSATVGMEDDPRQVQVSAQVQPGNSGGPLLDAQGEVIGMVTSTLNVELRKGITAQNVNFALKTGPILQFLSASKATLPQPTMGKSDEVFETAKKSLALVHGGSVTDEELKQPSLVCVFSYLSHNVGNYDSEKFQAFEIRFQELKHGEIVFKAKENRYDILSSEDEALNHVFAEISAEFFPNQPNPFKTK